MTKTTLKMAAFLLAAFALPVNQARAVAGDYDGDGLADLAIIDADEPEDKTTVFVRKSSTGGSVAHVFHPFGNYVISGRFFGGNKTYPGIVSIPSTAGKPLEWHVKNPFGTENVFFYGVKGDVVPNQGDLDCDGTADVVVTRTGTGNFWPGFQLWYAMLSSQPGIVHQTVFGLAGDKPYTADVNGDGCSEIVVLRGNYDWYSKNFFGSDSLPVQWGLSGDIPIPPADMTGDGVPDFIIARRTGSGQVAFVRKSDGSAMNVNLGSAGSLPMAGNFFGSNTFAWFERSQGKFGLKTPAGSTSSVTFGNARRGIVRPDGSVVTENEDGRFSGSVVSTPSNNNSGGVTCNSNIRRNDGSGGFKNNPENSKNTVKVMFPKNFTGNIREVTAYSGNDKFDSLRLGGLEWGNRERWYGRKSLSSYPNNLLIVATLDNGTNACVTLPDPEQVYD